MRSYSSSGSSTKRCCVLGLTRRGGIAWGASSDRTCCSVSSIIVEIIASTSFLVILEPRSEGHSSQAVKVDYTEVALVFTEKTASLRQKNERKEYAGKEDFSQRAYCLRYGGLRGRS